MTNEFNDSPTQLCGVRFNKDELVGIDDKEPTTLFTLLYDGARNQITIVEIEYLIFVDRVEDFTER